MSENTYSNIKTNLILILLSITIFFVTVGSNNLKILLSVSTVVIFAAGGFKGCYNNIKNPFTIAILLFILYNIVGFLWTTDYRYGLSIFNKFQYYLLLPLIICCAAKSNTQRVLFRSLYIGMVAGAFFSALAYFDIFRYNNVERIDPSPFTDRLNFSVMLGVFAIFTINYIIDKKHHKKILPVTLLIIFLITLFFNTGRSGQLGFLVSFIIMVIYYAWKKISWKLIISSLALIILLGYTVYQYTDTAQTRMKYTLTEISQLKNGNLNSSLGHRITYWIVSSEIIKSNIIFGVGTGDGLAEIKKQLNGKFHYWKAMIDYMQHSHNQYVEILLRGGIVGLILFFNIFYQLFRISSKKPDWIRLNIIFITIFYLIACMTDAFFERNYALPTYIALISILLSADEGFEF